MKTLWTNALAGVLGGLLVAMVQTFPGAHVSASGTTSGIVDCIKAKQFLLVEDDGTVLGSWCYSDKVYGSPLVAFCMGSRDNLAGRAVWMHSCKYGADAICWQDHGTQLTPKLELNGSAPH